MAEQNTLEINREFWKKLMLLLTSILVIMADLTVSPILPKMQEAFPDVSNINLLVKLVLTTPAIFIVVSSPFIGYLLDKYGRKNIILLSIFVYILAGTSGFYANSIHEILIGRAFLGISTAGVINGCSALIGDYYQKEEINNMMGLQSTFIGYGGLLCLFLGGFLGDIHWRATFLVYLLPVGLLLLFARFIDEPGIKYKSREKESHLIFPEKSFLKKLAVIYLIAFTLMIFFYMLPLQIPFYLKSIMPISNTQIGLTIAMMPLFSATTAIFYKKIKRRFSFRNIFIISFIIMGLGYITISAVTEYLFSLLGMIFTGMGMGMIIPNLRTWVGSCSDSAFLGRAFGGLTACIYLGQFFSPIIINQIINFSGIAISSTFTLAGVFMMTVSILFFFVRRENNVVD